MRQNRGLMMRRLWLVLLLLTLLVSGCGKQAPPPVDADTEPIVVQKEKVPAIVSADVPERDPFATRSGSTSTGEAGTVPTEGRNPFVLASASDEWQEEQGTVDTSGRNPFVEGSGEVIEPPPPVEEPIDDPDEPPIEEPSAGEITLEVTTLERCWLDVFVDDERVLRTNVPVGETLRWQGQQEVQLAQVGRIWAVEVTVNGQKIGLLEDLVKKLVDGPITEAGVRISMERMYPGGVLVGLSFSAIE
ncbi:MAG: DUF4115 domain-containing protein [Firmicutes bacterium]|nr:DUF4115 domain-containing protein [Bacillota bacterium]